MPPAEAGPREDPGPGRPGNDPDVQVPGLVPAAERARRAFMDGNAEEADRIAAEELRAEADGAEADPRRAAEWSTLLGIRGGVAARAGRLDDAHAHFERSLRRAHGSRNPAAIVAATLNLLDVRTRRGDQAAGEPLFEEAARLAKGTPFEDVLAKLVIERGLAAIAAGKLPDALQLFDRATGIRPSWPFPWYQRAWARFLGGDASGALEDYRACASRRRPFFTVLREIRCLEDVAAGRLPLESYRSYCVVRERVRAQPAAVEESARRLVERHPDFAPALLLLAEARLALGDPEGAGEAVTATLAHDPDEDTAAAALFLQWNLARAKSDDADLGDVETRLLEAYPESPAAAIVRRLRDIGRRDVALRWTWALDGTFRLDEGVVARRPDGGDPPPA